MIRHHQSAFYNDVYEYILSYQPTKTALSKHKLVLCKKHSITSVPTDIDVYLHAPEELIPHIKPFLTTKPVRTGSGVAVVATMTKPHPCPHGTCTYCPGGPKSAFGDTPKSYTGREPSTMRGARHDYDPYRIIFNRLEQYIVMGQNPDKVEQIIMGGTFFSLPEEYQEEYVLYSFKAYNDFSEHFYQEGVFLLDTFKSFFEVPGLVGDQDRARNIKERVLVLKSKNVQNLAYEHQRNERAVIRCVGLTIETRPDWGFLTQGLQALRLGATRIELGVQTLDDDVLRTIQRGHTLNDTQKSIRELRDLGFKLNFHMMPGLPGPDGRRVSADHDVQELKTLFTNSCYQPDMIKIYPCMVMKGTALQQWHEQGTYTPLTTSQAAHIIVEALKSIPEYCRIMRVQRDIPTNETIAGVDRTNLRQYVDTLSEQQGVKSKDIRAREIGTSKSIGEYAISTHAYQASGGTEHFLQAVSNEQLLGFLRLRYPSQQLHPLITPTTALIRELHVFGSALKIGTEHAGSTQHRGVGKALMARAEELCKNSAKTHVLVISGVGAREYYRSIGYEQQGPYMGKHL